MILELGEIEGDLGEGAHCGADEGAGENVRGVVNAHDDAAQGDDHGKREPQRDGLGA